MAKVSSPPSSLSLCLHQPSTRCTTLRPTENDSAYAFINIELLPYSALVFMIMLLSFGSVFSHFPSVLWVLSMEESIKTAVEEPISLFLPLYVQTPHQSPSLFTQ